MATPTKSILDFLFFPTRHRHYLGSRPIFVENSVDPRDTPFLSSNTQGRLLQVKASSNGVARMGLFSCSLEEEGGYLAVFLKQLRDLSLAQEWGNVCGSLTEAMGRLQSNGCDPRTLVLSYNMLSVVGVDLTSEEVNSLMFLKGYVSQFDSVRVVVAPLPDKMALLASAPSFVGSSVRVGDYIGLMVYAANRTLAVISDAST